MRFAKKHGFCKESRLTKFSNIYRGIEIQGDKDYPINNVHVGLKKPLSKFFLNTSKETELHGISTYPDWHLLK